MDFWLKWFVFLQRYVRRLRRRPPGRLFLSVLVVAAGCVSSECVVLCNVVCRLLWVLSSITASLPPLQISALRLPRGYQGKCSLLVSLRFFLSYSNSSSDRTLQNGSYITAPSSLHSLHSLFWPWPLPPPVGWNTLYTHLKDSCISLSILFLCSLLLLWTTTMTKTFSVSQTRIWLFFVGWPKCTVVYVFTCPLSFFLFVHTCTDTHKELDSSCLFNMYLVI